MVQLTYSLCSGTSLYRITDVAAVAGPRNAAQSSSAGVAVDILWRINAVIVVLCVV